MPINEIPSSKLSCKICVYAGESPISGACEGCCGFGKFKLDHSKICKWCYNPAAENDNVCESCRKSMQAMAAKFEDVFVDKFKAALENAYLSGFMASDRDYNATLPFEKDENEILKCGDWKENQTRAVNSLFGKLIRGE
jgi:RecJ-like exonuclease